MDKQNITYIITHRDIKWGMEYYSAIKREILPFAITWMDLEGIMLSEISQIKINISLTCGILKTNKQKKMKTDC